MPNCAIVNCKNSTKIVGRVNGDISFHRFPNDPTVKEKWIAATGNKEWFPTKYSAICSIHFDDADFVSTEKFRRLSKTAYPTIDVLITSEENADLQSTLKSSTRKQDVYQNFTSNETPFISPMERKLQNRLKAANDTIRQKNLKIKSLREQNRRKARKILSLVTIIGNLKHKLFTRKAKMLLALQAHSPNLKTE